MKSSMCSKTLCCFCCPVLKFIEMEFQIWELKMQLIKMGVAFKMTSEKKKKPASKKIFLEIRRSLVLRALWKAIQQHMEKLLLLPLNHNRLFCWFKDPARDVEVKAKLKVKIPCSDGIQMTSSNSAGGLGEFRTSWEISLSCDEEPEELSSNLWRRNSSHECTFQDPALRLDPPQTTPTDGHMATKDPARTWCCARCQSDAGDSLKFVLCYPYFLSNPMI